MERVAPAPILPRPERAAVVAGCGLAVLAGPLAVLLPPVIGVALVGAGGLMLAVALRPAVAAYALLALTPLTAGIERGKLLPLLRPSEALLLIVVGGLAARGLAELLRGASWRPSAGAVAWALLALVVTGSVIPLLWMLARGREITADDRLYASYLWKYAVVFLVVRASVRTETEVRASLWISMASAAVVALVAVGQSLRLFGIPELLSAWYTPSEGQESLASGRGTSTVSSSFAVADIMVMNLALAAAWLFRRGARRELLVGAALVFLLGTIAAGQFSGFLALGIGVVTVGLVLGRLRQFLAIGLATTAASVVVLWPVVAHRVADFNNTLGLPRSWVGPQGRLANLETFFWPQVFSHFNWLTGVRTAARVRAPETWRHWVWIESGQTWLLWTGGLLFLVGCYAFLWVAIRTVARIARDRADAVGVAAVGSLTGLWLNVVLMTFDVHLTMRGAADLNFALLALALVACEGMERGQGAAET